MKKVVLILLLLSVTPFFGAACAAKETDNANKGGNNNANASETANTNSNQGGKPNTNQGITRDPATKPDFEKIVQVVVNDTGSGKCSIEVPPAFQSIRLKRGRDSVSWLVDNNCEAGTGAVIVIENFGGKNAKPFGGDACDNKFTVDPIEKSRRRRANSRTAKVDGTFKYTIKLVAANGTIAELDPEIIVGLDVQ